MRQLMCLLVGWAFLFALLACQTGAGEGGAEVVANLDAVFTVPGGAQARPLAANERARLQVGDGIDVDEAGRATIFFADGFATEVLRAGGLTVQALDISDRSVSAALAQQGGTLLNNFDANAQVAHRFTIQGDFATITATGTRFLVVREEGSPLEWIISLEAGEQQLEVEAGGVARWVPTGVARWVAPIGEPSAGIDYDRAAVDQWVQALRQGAAQPEVGEVLWPHADLIADTAPIDQMPALGDPFVLEGVTMQLDPEGTTGAPRYERRDCNGDGIQDIAMEQGRLLMDFRPLPRRVRAMDVTLWNAGPPGSGEVRSYDPARQVIGTTPVTVGPDQGQTVTLNAARPYHYAEVELERGCFLGFSLRPPREAGGEGLPRDAASIDPVPPEGPAPSPTPVPTKPTIASPTVGRLPTPTATLTPTPATLLRNGNAEERIPGAGRTTAWEQIEGQWDTVWQGGGALGSPSYFAPMSSGYTELRQDVPMRAYAPAIKSGQFAFDFRSFARSGQEGNYASVRLEFLGADGSLIDLLMTDTLYLPEWKELSFSFAPPPDTWVIRVRLQGHTNDPEQPNLTYWDEIQLVPAARGPS